MRNVLIFSLLTSAFSVNAGQLPLTTAKDTPQLAEAYGQLPLSFEMNRGQTDEAVKFLSRGQGYTLFLTPTEAVLSLRKPEQKTDKPQRGGKPEPKQTTAKAAETLALQMQLLGANNNPDITGVDELPGKINYLKGNDPKQWRQNVATYGKVQYQNVYPGIDLVYYGKQRQLEYDFIVQPGANPNDIRLNFKGADKIKLADNGDLLLNAKSGEVRLEKPVLYQTINGERHEVAGKFVLQNPLLLAGEGRGEGKFEKNQQIGFQVAAYDTDQPLVIDPVLVYSSYLGGSYADHGFGIAVDSAGNAYMTGSTNSYGFPHINAKYPNFSGGNSDAFVTKFNANGSQVLYSTYLGGSGWGDDHGNAIAVDSAGNAYVTGRTDSSDFPTVNAKYPNYRGNGGDAFVTKFNTTGDQVLYSTYLGSYGWDEGNAIAVDSAGNAYVTGSTDSSDFPAVNAKYPFPGGINAFVTKFNAIGSQVLYSTYLGGSNYDYGQAIAVDSAGNAIVTGKTESTDFPAVNAKYPNLQGGWDAFVTKFNGTGSQVLYSTYLGGSDWDTGAGIAVDSAGNAYVVGSTYSANFPTVNAKYPNIRGSYDAFVAKFNVTGNQLLYSTYLGGSDWDTGAGIAVDSAGNAYVTGLTDSANFPTVNAKYPKLWGFEDAFVTKFNANGSQVLYSTYLGGSSDDNASGIAVDSAGNAYVTGSTDSSNFPSHANDASIASFDSSINGASDAFIAKLAVASSVLPTEQANLGIILNRTGSTEPVFSGDTINLAINVANTGPKAAGNVVVSLNPPVGTTLSTSETGCTVNPVLRCALGSIPAGGVHVLSLTLTVQSTAKQTLNLTASATSQNYDPNSANNASTLSMPINQNVAVILVHGFMGTPASFSGDGEFLDVNRNACVADTAQQDYLTKGCLPHFGNLLRDKAQFLVAQPFDYSDKTPTGSGATSWTIPRLAGELHKHIQCVLSGECMYPKGTKVDRVDIIAHSMGGLVTRAYIANMAKDANNNDALLGYNGKIRRVITAGTPHYGASVKSLFTKSSERLASKGQARAGILPAQVIDLDYGSVFLKALNDRWAYNVIGGNVFASNNLLTVRGTRSYMTADCKESTFDGLVEAPSATLPGDLLSANNIRYTPYPHTDLKCISQPSLVGVDSGDITHYTYQYATTFLAGLKVPTGYAPSTAIRNNALLLVRLVDSTTNKPINPAPTLGTNAALKLDGTVFEPTYRNSAGGTMTAVPIPLTGSSQIVSLQVVPPSGYQAPSAINVALQAGRPRERVVYLTPK